MSVGELCADLGPLVGVVARLAPAEADLGHSLACDGDAREKAWKGLSLDRCLGDFEDGSVVVAV